MIKARFLTLYLALLGAASAAVLDTQNYPDWETYKVTFNKHYSDTEDPKRKNIFLENVVKVMAHNIEATRGLHHYTLGVNQFTDVSYEEFYLHNGIARSVILPNNSDLTGRAGQVPDEYFIPDKYNQTVPESELPIKVDWREKNVVSPVISQKGCGSCWAISAAGTMESMWAIKTGKLVPLSIQNLLDCVDKDGNSGCDGGNVDAALEYVVLNKGIVSSDCYPYLAKQQHFCHYTTRCKVASFSKFLQIAPGDEKSLREAVALYGPVAASLNSEAVDLQHYKEGIFNNPACKKDITHGVLIVGYGTSEDGLDYWIVKNSWGTKWGENGYFRLARNGNMCGISNMASFPVV